MCFSAQASFVASGLLSFIGFLAVLKSYKKNQKFRPLLLTPLIFALQQAFEGIIWISLYSSYKYLAILAGYGFLFFAFIFWPLWIPLALYKESSAQKKHAMLVSFIFGITSALLLVASLIKNPLAISIEHSHIVYDIVIPTHYYFFILASYFIATVLPFFLIKKRGLLLFGILLSVSYCISLLFYYTAFTSVWCFFAAILSGLILWIA